MTGHAEQWGNVSRKKDKPKPSSGVSSANARESFSPSGTPPPRGGRGGARGGRGGFARGSRGGGPSRSSTPREKESTVNGTSPAPNAFNSDAWGDAPVDNASAIAAANDWGNASTDYADDWSVEPAPELATKAPESKVSSSGWDAAPTPAPSKVNGITATPVQAPVPVRNTSAVVGGKLSWAQIARLVTAFT